MAKKKKEIGEVSVKAEWDHTTTMILCDLCIREISIGNRPSGFFNKDGLENIERDFKGRTNKDYNKDQIRSKWDQLKETWKLWKELKQNDTGLGWDFTRNTVDATAEWWDAKIKSNPKFKRFKRQGVLPELEDKLATMFTGVVATGQNVWAPSCGFVPTDTPTNLEGSGDSDEELKVSEEAPVINVDSSTEMFGPGASCNKKRCADKNKPQKRKAKSRKSGDESLQLMEQLRENLQTVSNATSRLAVEPTFDEAFDVLNSMEEVSIKSELIFFAGSLLGVKEKRSLFMKLKPEEKFEYLKWEFHNYKK